MTTLLPAVEVGNDEELIQHLEDRHPGSLLHKINNPPHQRGPRVLEARVMYETFHEMQHRNGDHDHEHTDKELAVPEGKSILRMLWDELDRLMDVLMADEADEDGGDPFRAQGLGLAIAIMTNPYDPDLDSVRAEAVRRWEERQE